MKRICLLAVMLIATITTAFGQFETGSLSGSLKDPSGALIPGATVSVRNQATGVTRTAKATGSGEYYFVALEPGHYTVTAAQPGFTTLEQNFQIAVGQRLQLDLQMTLATANEKVSVVAESSNTIQTASSDLGNIETGKEVRDLPLNSRNFTQLVGLSAGANMHAHSNNSQALGYTIGRGANGAVINGNPGEDTVYLFDGIQSVNNDIQAVIFFPTIDAIQEFKVQTSGSPAAYGFAPSMINLTFRSGTNQFHGSFYEFLRNSAFDAKNYFDSHTKPITPFHMNQFGATVGGPVRIPHVFNGRDKLFFFADWEGRRVDQAQTYISTVPTAAFTTGNFAALCTAGFTAGICNNAAQQLHNPATGAPFLNNIIDPSLWDPAAAKLIKLFPAANITGTGLVNNYLFSGPLVNNINQGDIRIDYRLGQNSIFGRFSKEDPVTVNPGYLPAPAIGGGPSRPGTTPVPGEQIVLGLGRPIGANGYYDARLGWSRMNEQIIIANNNDSDLSTQYGIPGANADGIPGLTNFAISGQVGLGDGYGNLRKIDNNWEFTQAFTLEHGNHEFQAGVDYMSRYQANYDPLYPAGNFTFTGAYTGYGLADFLLGHPISSELDSAEFLGLHRFFIGLYAQDNFRVTPKLVIQYGVRDDMVTPWTERHNRLAGFDPRGSGNLVPVGQQPFPGRSVVDGHYDNLGPRFGFAYSIDPRTVFRGGAGIYYANENLSGNPFQANAPFHGSYITTNASGAAGYLAAQTISQGFPSDRPTLFPIQGTTVNYYPRSYKNPTSNEYSLDIQRQLTRNDVLTVAYSGQTATHILILPNINQPISGPGTVNPRRPYPNFATINETCQCANSHFNSLQVSYKSHIDGVLDLLASYMWSHSIDDSSGAGNITAPQDPQHWWLSYRGNSDFDLRHSLVLSWTYTLPVGHGHFIASGAPAWQNEIIGGWQLNSIDTFQTGTPFTPVMTTSLLNTGGSVQYPNRIGSGKAAHPGPDEWFNPADFVSPGQYQFGNSGRNILYGPGTREIDASLFKSFGLGENGARFFEFRIEAFNALNTPQFNNPNASIGSPSAGTITSAGTPQLFQRTSREIQLAGKLYW